MKVHLHLDRSAVGEVGTLDIETLRGIAVGVDVDGVAARRWWGARTARAR